MLTKADRKARARENHARWYKKNGAKLQAKRRARYATDPAYRASRREAKARRFGDHRLHPSKLMTYGEYRRRSEEQGGLCSICYKFVGTTIEHRKKGLHIDHNHVTGKVRGLLCSQCNTAIGLLQDDPDLCRRVASYLERPAQC